MGNMISATYKTYSIQQLVNSEAKGSISALKVFEVRPFSLSPNNSSVQKQLESTPRAQTSAMPKKIQDQSGSIDPDPKKYVTISTPKIESLLPTDSSNTHKKFQEDAPNSARVTAAKENLDPESENLC